MTSMCNVLIFKHTGNFSKIDTGSYETIYSRLCLLPFAGCSNGSCHALNQVEALFSKFCQMKSEEVGNSSFAI